MSVESVVGIVVACWRPCRVSMGAVVVVVVVVVVDMAYCP
jgi:hypothetical protein